MTDPSDTGPVPSPAGPADSVPPQPMSAPVPVGRDALRPTRTGNVWLGIGVFAVVLVLLLIFILQNTQSVTISYLGATGHLPLAVAILLAAVGGVLLTVTAGSLRIWQLRRRLRHSIPDSPPAR